MAQEHPQLEPEGLEEHSRLYLQELKEHRELGLPLDPLELHPGCCSPAAPFFYTSLWKELCHTIAQVDSDRLYEDEVSTIVRERPSL